MEEGQPNILSQIMIALHDQCSEIPTNENLFGGWTMPHLAASLQLPFWYRAFENSSYIPATNPDPSLFFSFNSPTTYLLPLTDLAPLLIQTTNADPAVGSSSSSITSI